MSVKCKDTFEQLQHKIVEWGDERGILDAGCAMSQMLKCVSEVGELADGIAKDDYDEITDGIGDVLVTLILLAEVKQIDLVSCLNDAYIIIANRRGKMVNGVFVKDS